MLRAIKYSLFAVVAGVANIYCQDLENRLYEGRYELYVSIAAGTLAGLVVKYILDKKYIFMFHAKSLIHDSQKFFLYSLMGSLATGVFWGMETMFDYAFQTLMMRYIGAVIGLSAGYFMKYQLDKRYVFVEYA